MSKQSIVTDLVGVFVMFDEAASGKRIDGVVRAVFLDDDSEVQALVQRDDNGTLDRVYARTNMIIRRDFRGAPVRERKSR